MTEEIIKKCVSKKNPAIGIESEWRSKWSIEWSAFAKMLSDTCYHKVLWFYKWQKFAQHSCLIFRLNFSIWFFAFAFNAKKLCNCHSIFFLFFLLVAFSGRTAKSFLGNVLSLVTKKTCDQDLTTSLDTKICFRKNCS